MTSFGHHEHTEEYLRENQLPSDENIALFKAALAGSMAGVESALSRHAKPNFFHRPEDNKNSLHVAAENGYLDIVEVLIKHGAIVDCVAVTCQSTPLILAAHSGHASVVRYLISQGADVHAKNCYGNTALHSACRAGSIDCVDVLLAAHADVNATNHKGSTPLHFACYGQDAHDFPITIARALLQAGATVDALDHRGCTPFLLCCSTGRLDIVNLLRECGADITVKNSAGQDAQAIAEFFNHPAMAIHFGTDAPAKRFS